MEYVAGILARKREDKHSAFPEHDKSIIIFKLRAVTQFNFEVLLLTFWLYVGMARFCSMSSERCTAAAAPGWEGKGDFMQNLAIQNLLPKGAKMT